LIAPDSLSSLPSEPFLCSDGPLTLNMTQLYPTSDKVGQPAKPQGSENSASSGHPGGLHIAVTASDLNLAERMLAGESWAFDAFYRKHVERCYRLALRLVAHREDAEDVVQDAFSEAFRDLGQLKELGALGGWLRRIVVNRAHRRFRRRNLLRRLGIGPSEVVPLEELGGPQISQESLVELRFVGAALNRASGSARTCWILRHVEGHSLAEVAELAGVSLATAKRRIADANAILQTLRETPEASQ